MKRKTFNEKTYQIFKRFKTWRVARGKKIFFHFLSFFTMTKLIRKKSQKSLILLRKKCRFCTIFPHTHICMQITKKENWCEAKGIHTIECLYIQTYLHLKERERKVSSITKRILLKSISIFHDKIAFLKWLI